MLAFLFASKALALWAAASGFLGYTLLINDAPARALQAYAKLGVQLTLESPKLLARWAPVTRISFGEPLFPMAPSVNVPGAPINASQNSTVDFTLSDAHTTEPSYNSSAAASTFAPTKTHNSPRYLPVLGPRMNFTLPTALVERAQSLPPYSLLANPLLSAPLPHGLIRAIRVLTTQLSTNLDPHLGFIGLALAIVICIIWICYQVGQEAKARSEQVKNYKVLELAYQDAAALNDILGKANEDLQGRNHHLSSTLSSTFDVIIRQGDRVQELTGDFEQATERSEFSDGNCKVLVLENNRLAQVNTNLRGQNHNLGCQLNASKTRCNRLLGEVDKYGTRNQQLEDAAKVLQSERNEAVQELGSVKSDHDALAQRAEDYQIRAENSEKAHADSQSEVERMVAENSRLATVNRETKLRHEQEKEEMTEQLAKANKELHGLKSLPKSTKPPKSAAQKQLENENAKLKSDLKQGKQEKEVLRKANEDSSSRFESLEEKWKQSQDEAEAARVTINRLENEANERETARDAQEKKSRAELDVLVSEKSTAEMELKTAKEEKCALAKKVSELSTASPPSSQNAQASFNTSSYQSPQTQTIHNYEARVAGLNKTLARANHKISMLESRLRATGSHPPAPMNMSGANHLRPGAPFHQPMPVSGPLGMPSIPSGGAVHGYNTGPHFHYNGAPIGPMIAPTGSLGYASFPPGGQAQGMNPGFVPHPQAHNGPVFPSNGHQGPIFNSGPFPPLHHHGGPSLPSRSGTNNYEYPPLNPGALPSPQKNDNPTASPKPQDGRQGAPLDPGAASFTPGGGN